MADTHPNSDRYPHHHRHGGSSSSILSSCLIATIFLLLVVGAGAAVLFTLFRPRDPAISVSSVRLPSYSAANGTVRFTFFQNTAVRNPNRAPFSHYDSSLQVAHQGAQVGFMFIPAGEIDAGRTQYMAATFDVGSFPAAAAMAGAEGGGSLEVVSRMKVRGRVKVLRFFTHRVEATVSCRVAVAARDGSVLNYRC